MSYDAILARSPFIIYQPGGTASALVVTSWTGVQKFIAARQGAVTVYVDDSITSPAPVPAGTTDCQGRVTFAGAVDKIVPAETAISLADGAVLINPAGFTGFLHVICQGATQPNMQLTTGFVVLVQFGSKIDNQGSQPVVSLAATQANAFVFTFGGSFQANPAQLVDMPVAPADVALLVFTNGGFQGTDNVITGVVGTNASLSTDASLANGGAIPSNPGFAGTFNVNLVDKAQLVSYLPAIPANWPVPPTQVAQALDELAAGGATSTVIWRPGGVKAGNVVTTAADVQAAIDRVQGAITVYIDTSITPANVDANWNGYGSAQIAPTNNSEFFTILDGFTLTNFASMQDLTAVCQCVTTQAFAFSIYQSFLLWNFGTISLAAGALVPAIIAPAGAGSTFAMFSLLGALDNSNAPTVPAVSTAVGGWTTFYPHSSAFNLPFLNTGNEIGGAPGSQVSWEYDDTVAPLASTLFTGTLNQDPSSDAANVSYEPAVPANWPVPPTEVAQALDELAAHASPFEQVGTLISAIDQTAGVSFGAEGGNTVGAGAFGFGAASDAVNPGDVAWDGGSASGNPSFALFASTASGADAFAVGTGSIASGGNSVALAGAMASGSQDFAVGSGGSGPSTASGGDSVAFGGAVASGPNSFAVDQFAVASAPNSIAIGYQAIANLADAVAIGGFSMSTANYAIAGSLSTANGPQSIAFCGGQTSATATSSAAIGENSVNFPDAYKLGTDGAALVSLNADGLGTAEIDCGANTLFKIGNVGSQTTVGAAGPASPLPASPTIYLLATINGTPYAIPCFAPA